MQFCITSKCTNDRCATDLRRAIAFTIRRHRVNLPASHLTASAGLVSAPAAFAKSMLQSREMGNCSYVRFSSALIARLSICASISGCGASVPFNIVPVHGKVAYDDGSLIPADSMLVTFNPIRSGEKGKIVPPGGQTQVNVQDGTFSAVSSHRAYDGLAIGRHKVVVVSFKKGPMETRLHPTRYRPSIATRVRRHWKLTLNQTINSWISK